MDDLESKRVSLLALQKVKVALYWWQVQARTELASAIEIIVGNWSTKPEREEIRFVDTSSLGGCTTRVAPALNHEARYCRPGSFI